MDKLKSRLGFGGTASDSGGPGNRNMSNADGTTVGGGGGGGGDDIKTWRGWTLRNLSRRWDISVENLILSAYSSIDSRSFP